MENTDFTSGFHEYTVILEPGTLKWLVDGVEMYSTTPKFDAYPMELAVAEFVGSCDSFSGCPDGNGSFPQTLDIDYIRVYSR
jgi:beta-glucanase (GH16 family)